MDGMIEKWVPCVEISNGWYQMKCLMDFYDGLSVKLENLSDDESLEIRWEGQVEAYRCTEEGMRYKFISREWKNIRKVFPEWSFFICKKSSYINWLYDEADGFVDAENLVHYLIVTSDIVLEVISRCEPIVEFFPN